ncbi:MAG: HAD-IA family hydrolase [Bacteroidales bacterium]|nr:HAD-IA family hydrolase [Bacteroidales bacterium]
MRSLCDTVFCFDLDDTLYPELDFLKSGYRALARELGSELNRSPEGIFEQMLGLYMSGCDNVFARIARTLGTGMTVDRMVGIYRCHRPELTLPRDSFETLSYLKENGAALGLVTDGRSITQRNKISALGLTDFFDEGSIVISEEFGSEKPDEANFEYFRRRWPGCAYTYVGDNERKDFLSPNRLGWTTFRVGCNVSLKREDIDVPPEFRARYEIGRLSELISF